MIKKRVVQKVHSIPDEFIVPNPHIKIHQKAIIKEHLFEDFELSFNVLKERQVSLNISPSQSPQKQNLSKSMMNALQTSKQLDSSLYSVDQIDQVYQSPRRQECPISPLLTEKKIKITAQTYESQSSQTYLNRISKGLTQLKQSCNEINKKLIQISFTKIVKAQSHSVIQQKRISNPQCLSDSRKTSSQEMEQQKILALTLERRRRVQVLAHQYCRIQLMNKVLNAWKGQTLITLSQQKVTNFLNNLEQKKVKKNVLSPRQKSTSERKIKIEPDLKNKSIASRKSLKEVPRKSNDIHKIFKDGRHTPIQKSKIQPKNPQISISDNDSPTLQYYRYKILSKYFRRLRKIVQIKSGRMINFLRFKEIRLIRLVLNSWFNMVEIQAKVHQSNRLAADKLRKKYLLRHFFTQWAKKIIKSQITTRSDRVGNSTHQKNNGSQGIPSLLQKSKLSLSQTKPKIYKSPLKPSGLKQILMSKYTFFKK